MAAVGELQPQYEGRVRFVVVPAEETAQRADEIEEFGFSAQKHGLVAFTGEGQALVKIPGHQFGKEEIVAAIDEVLAAGS